LWEFEEQCGTRKELSNLYVPLFAYVRPNILVQLQQRKYNLYVERQNETTLMKYYHLLVFR